MTGKQSRKGDGRVAFLANADKFRELLNAGHPQRSIYDDHAAALGISYSQFNRYVGKYLLAKEDDHGHQTKQATGGSGHQKPGAPQAAPAASSGGNASSTANTITERKPAKPVPFSHDPNSGNDRDLI
ncbi:TraK family protein [Pseudomonas aeruginosa]|uniref:TraK family protein n=1 Tax=Pseudomonas aeruginosa TaxID=287 RepID=UPI003CC6A3D8